ncbi:hypothetical protein [Symbiobacterium thermophilum]|uniref:hypothetical protein n=1 Tax=Symbiobacterium thermophilum TaxID=2734 RepID=UPI002357F4E9|nr:hypothetical protein [Symbiobacterium thermophilum]
MDDAQWAKFGDTLQEIIADQRSEIVERVFLGFAAEIHRWNELNRSRWPDRELPSASTRRDQHQRQVPDVLRGPVRLVKKAREDRYAWGELAEPNLVNVTEPPEKLLGTVLDKPRPVVRVGVPTPTDQ